MLPHDWADRFVETVERHRVAPFEWGRYDCATLVRDVAFALGAPDPFDGEVWTSASSAALAVRRRYCVSVREFIGRRLVAVPPSFAGRGDVGFANTEHILMCPAVITGAQAVSRSETGWIVMPVTLLTECYRLG
jgi:hypothetical protein